MAAQGPITFSLPANVKKNIQLFNTLSMISKAQPNKASRFNAFVVTLGTPNLPRRHPGVDHSFHPHVGIDEESLDLLQRGNATLKYIQKNSKKPCPSLIFLNSFMQNDDAYSPLIYQGHAFADYKKAIEEEKQLPLEFHFSGHGDPEKVGTMLLENRVRGDMLADLFDQLMDLYGLKESLLKKEHPLHFNFHVCNSAYVEIEKSDRDATLKQKILNDSVIGNFFQEMRELGYHNIIVTGHRGYYQTMNSGSGSRITDSTHSPTLNIDANDALHVIQSVGEKVDVQLPKKGKFDVKINNHTRVAP